MADTKPFYNKLDNRLFYLWLVILCVFFFWSRLDSSNRIYYFGDGNIIVEMIRLMLSTHNWDPNWARLADQVHPQEEMRSLIEVPKSTDIFYHMSGYMFIGATACKIIYALGFPDIPIQSVLRGLNIFFQVLTMYLLFAIGRKLFDRYLGLFSATLFALFPLATMEAHYERPEAWMCLLATAILYCGVFLKEQPKLYGGLIGVLIGLSIATKISQVIIGIIPAILLLYLWTTASGSIGEKTKGFLLCSVISAACIFLTVWLHTPFIIQHFADMISGTASLAKFYSTPVYPYAAEHYSYSGQLSLLANYFSYTLGPVWCVFLLIGFAVAASPRYAGWPRAIYLAAVIPVIVFLIYFSLQVNFIERNFSSIEGLIALVTALGFFHALHWTKKLKIKSPLIATIFAVITILMLYPPLKLNFNFVERYIHHPNATPRIAFQDELKHDFQGFWIKNVFFTYKVNQQIPDKPEKMPRIYQIDDLNEYWTRNYLLTLKNNNFRHIASYCSDFADMPPNTLTLYHGAAKNHYFVRVDEWPQEIPADYFKTNCR